MWDGRETLSPLTSAATFLDNMKVDLAHQAISAVATHAEGKVTPTDAQLQEITEFEMGLYTAQVWDRSADRLDRGRSKQKQQLVAFLNSL